jgi:uncharacterized membrane protein YhhN
LLAALSLAILGSAALAILTDTRAPRAYRLFKPLTTILVIGVAWLAPAEAAPLYRQLVLIGLGFSLAGDVFLMLPAHPFIAGLASFLVAHILYVAAFTSAAPAELAPLAFAPFAVAAGFVLRALWPHLGRLRIPVVIYVLAIALMIWRAGAQWTALGSTAATLALVGAALFGLSDAVLALNRFRAPIAGAQAVVLSTYWAAQWAIALPVHRTIG